MHQLKDIRASLEVGFPGGNLPERFANLRGREWRSIGKTEVFPYEDSQFDVVLMDGSVVSRTTVKEANRVLNPEGMLFFIVPEKFNGQSGYSLPDVYAVVREGFNIIAVERPAWWYFGRRGRTLTITAQKKRWKGHQGLVRNGSVLLSSFMERK